MSDEAKVIPFPEREPPQDVLRVTFSGDGFTGKCNGIVHSFNSVHGRCECGSEFWNGATTAGEGRA